MQAAESQNSAFAEVVRLLLAAGGNATATDSRGWTPLMRAAQSRSSTATQAIRLLAAAGGDTQINAQNQYGSTALMQSASRGNPELTRLLLAMGADVNADTHSTALIEAAASRNAAAPETVRLLLDAGAHASIQDENVNPPLMCAASNNSAASVEILQLLLDAGAGEDVNIKRWWGKTALMRIEGDKEIQTAKLKLLLAAGADVNTRDTYGKTPLMTVAYSGNNEAVRLLLAAGSDVNASDNKGWTALLEAALGGHIETVHLLMDAGAHPLSQLSPKPRLSLPFFIRKEILRTLKDAGAL
ncbi:MAG: ankyrin repeat domain-containing protein [Rhodocyclaceae bacterium]|nr:ankyrin repeat domain-containing protein [Rhodocyclaceae bacterium]